MPLGPESMSSDIWRRRRDLLAEWVRLSEKQLGNALAGAEPGDMQALLLAKERLVAELDRLSKTGGDEGAEDFMVSEVLELARRAQLLDEQTVEALKAQIVETRASLSGLGDVRQYVRTAQRPPARFIDRYE